MLTGQNQTVSGSLAGLVEKAGAKIASAIQNASTKTGVDFSYLLQQAKIESSFRSDVKASTSSATGLYQFIDSTWLSMVDKYGDKYGLSNMADSISDNGKVACSAIKKDILDLRKDPELCSLMAAELAAENKSHLEKTTNRDIGATELYMAHFMGPNGASKFLNALDKNPNANAAAMFPAAANANKGVFYDKSGKPQSLEQVYARFDKKFTVDAPQPILAKAEIIKPEVIKSEPDLSTSNVLAALTPRIATPLYSQHSSLFTNSVEENMDINSNPFPKSMYSMISPIDVLEILKGQYTSHNTNV